jgi:hypothetical protein
MAQPKPIHVFRFDYDLKGNQWTAYVAGYGQADAQDYLVDTVGHVQITSIGQECPLHAVSNKLRASIMETSKKKPGRPRKEATK